MNRSAYEPVGGAKSLDNWLLISEKNSCSTATWVSCLAGKKTLWVRNPSVDDQEVWSDFDIDDDHRLFSEPWARIPGTIRGVYTGEVSVFCGGHFLTPQIMNRFLRVLRQTELNLSRTNDSKGVDFFQILKNFILI